MTDNNLLEQHFRRAMQKLEETRAELTELKKSLRSPIAVVGMSCRFPGGANSIELFWEKLLSALPLSQDIPVARWDKEKYYAKDRSAPGKMYSTKAGLIDDIDLFDATFFGISRREAQLMDPQQRILLEETWQAFEVAGIAVDTLKGSNTGVFIGCGSHDYINHLTQGFSKDAINAYYGTGNSSSVIAGRVAYCFGFQGPAFTLDTACSSSLVAIHEACMALRQQECSLAVAGGVNAILTPDVMINFCKANMLAEDGLCKTFDSRADGYVRGEGVGVVILKRLEDAIADNDNILACIIGDAINQDGASSSLTSPNGDAQEKLIRETLTKFQINPSSIDYIEAHGTGTALGDPIEINALNSVFANTHTVDKPLYIGSVKTNIGHLESGAGVAGVIKVILSLLNQKIPAHLNFKQFNPLIDHHKIPLSVPSQAMNWPEPQNQRRASVSSFGFSGTNGYVVLEEFLKEEKGHELIERDCHPFILSAKSSLALQARIHAMEPVIEAANPDDIADICYTLNTGRVHFNHQIFISCFDKEDLLKKLRESVIDEIKEERDYLLLIRLGILTYANAYQLAQHFYHSSHLFKKYFIEASQALLDDMLLEDYWLQNVENIASREKSVCVFATLYALLKLLKAWGIEADYVMTDEKIAWVYAVFNDEVALPDAFNEMLNPSSAEKLNVVPDKSESLCVLNLFDCSHLALPGALKVEQYNLFSESTHFWNDLIGALKIINRHVARINWNLFETGYQRHKKILPTYPFERKRYWQNPADEKINVNLEFHHPFLTRRLNTPFANHQFLATISLEEFKFLADHAIYGEVLFPAAGFIELISATLRQIKFDKAFTIEEFQLLSPLILKEQEEQTLIISINSNDITFYHLNNTDQSRWNKLATARYACLDNMSNHNSELMHDVMESLPLPYADLKSKGVGYGSSFQSIKTLKNNEMTCFAEVHLRLPSDFTLLGLIDGALQAVGGFLLAEMSEFSEAIYLPHSFEKLNFYHYPTDKVFVKLLLIEKNNQCCRVDIFIYDAHEKLSLSIHNYRAEKIKRVSLKKLSDINNTIYYTLAWKDVSLLSKDLVVAPIDRTVFIVPSLSENEYLLEYYQRVLTQLQTQLNAIAAQETSTWIFVLLNTADLPGSTINPLHRFFVGMIKSLRLENPKKKIYSVDFDAHESTHTIERVINHLPEDQGLDLAYRNDKWYQLALLPQYVSKNTNLSEHAYSILITGGSSEISLSLVDELLTDPRATIILTARNIGNRLNQERVKWFLGDITDQAFVAKLLSDIQIKCPPLKVIIHAAGILQDGMFANLSWQAMRDVISVKALPLIYLDKACAENNIILEKFITLSSIATLSGGHGQIHYAGANSFMEGYMHTLRDKGISATAIALSPVTGSRMADSAPIVKRYPEIAITMNEAITAVISALHSDLPPLVYTLNTYFVEQLKAHKNYQSLFMAAKQNNFAKESIKGESIIHSLKDKSHSERVVLVKQFLLFELGRVMQLRPDEFNEHSGFFELGMDSLMAIELFDIIQAGVGDRVKLNSTLLFDIPNVLALTDYLIEAIFPKETIDPNRLSNNDLHRIDTLSDADLLNEIDELLTQSEVSE